MSTTTLAKVNGKNVGQVILLDANGDQVTSFGDGTQYTEGDTDASITGTAMLWEDTSDTLRAVSAAKPLPVVQTGTPGLPTGAATAANQSTIIGHVDGLEGLLTTIDADTGNISTKIDTLAGAVSGTEVQVDVLTMPTTTVQATNLDIRDLAQATDNVRVYANTAKDGSGTAYVPLLDTDGHLQIDVLSMPAGGSGLTDAELRATPVPVSGTVDLGATDNAVLDAIAASVAAIDTDTTTIIGHVDGLETLIGTTNTNTGAATTALQLIDDTIVTLGTDTYTETTSKGQVMGAVRRDADTTLVNTTNEFGPLQMDANGRLKVEAFSGETLPVSLTSTTITGTVAATQSGTWTEANSAAILTSTQLIDDTVATLGTTTYTEATTKGLIIGAVRRDADTTLANTTNEITPLQVDANGYLKVECFSGATLPVSFTGSGDVATQTTLASLLTSSQLIDDPVFADDAGYTLGTSKATIVGGVAVETDGTDPSSVSAEGDAAAFRTDRNRRLLVNKNHPNLWKVNENHSSAQTNNQLKAAPGAGLSFYITDIIISNGATAGSVQLVEDEGGTPATIAGPYYFAANGGIAMPLETPIRMTANKSLGFTSTTVTTHTVTVSGYIAP